MGENLQIERPHKKQTLTQWQLTRVILWSNAILFLFQTYICTQMPEEETFHSVWKNTIFFTTRMKKGIRPNSWPRGHRNSFLSEL